MSEGPNGTNPTRVELWDARHAAHDPIESAEADPTLVEVAATLTPGAALDLGAGDGRNAVWLAAHGWSVTAVDFSAVALEPRAGAGGEDRRRRRLAPRGLADLAAACGFLRPCRAGLHPPARGRAATDLRDRSDAVAPGGTLLVVGHDRANLDEGAGGPRDPDVLFTPGDIVRDLGPGWRIVRADTIRRPGSTEPAPIDAIVVAVRPAL